jgi:hypothetical protein
VFAAMLAAAVLEATPVRAGTPAGGSDPLDEIEIVSEPKHTLLPKYRPEWFVGMAYVGTFASTKHQWPTWLPVQIESLFFRPGIFDVGLDVAFGLGRPDESRGAMQFWFAPTVLARVVEESFWDFSPVVRVPFIVESSFRDQPLLRPSAGGRASLLRWVALTATVDLLASPSDPFADGSHLSMGFTLGLDVGLCPMLGACRQLPVSTPEPVDRAPEICRAASDVCCVAGGGEACGGAPRNEARARELCEATARALDPRAHPATWNDAVTPVLDAITLEASPALRDVIKEKLAALRTEHIGANTTIDRYADRKRELLPGKTFSRPYTYLVTPAAVRDWLGCTPAGKTRDCPSADVCDQETGVQR